MGFRREMRKDAYAVLTKSGGREINEDSVMIIEFPFGLIAAVADGLGAHGGGSRASKAAVETICQGYREGSYEFPEGIHNAVSRANEAVAAIQTPEQSGMTTVVFLIIEEDKAVWAHVGDSRLYHFKNKKMISHTLDHSVPQMAVCMDMITEDQIRFHPDRSRILRALGSESFEADISEPVSLHKDFHAFLLCSDGFWEYVLEKEMEETLIESCNPKQWLSKMEQCLKRKAPADQDNYTAAAVFIVEEY